MSRFEFKIVAVLLLVAVIPLVASVALVGQVIRVSDSVAEGQARRLAEPLLRAAGAYRSLFAARKQVFKLQAALLVRDRVLLDAVRAADASAAGRRLEALVRAEPGLEHAAVVDAAGGRLAQGRRSKRFARRHYRDLRLELPLVEGGARLQMTFFTPRQPFDEFQALGRAQRTAFELTSLRAELASYYRVVFLIIFGAVLLVATGAGVFIARRTTRQVAVLARATREVAEGDLQTQVKVAARDELGELAGAFNEMVRELRESRERIGYLEKIGAWQEIARRLAHEIKNPLTPIQLAVQQLHQKYGGQDPAFRKLLDDSRDIITEEVEGLRRLVQAFSAFARLPSVQPEPVDINGLIDDFLKSHVEILQRAQRVDWQRIDPPAQVMVDRMLIKHVLYNLLENAVQAAEDAGQAERLQVTITAARDEPRQRVVLTVADNGPGMPPEVAARVFDPYYTTKEEGTGLGLAIVKKIVLEHRGSIAVASQPGQGASFRLTLPLVASVPTVTLRTTLSRLIRGQD